MSEDLNSQVASSIDQRKNEVALRLVELQEHANRSFFARFPEKSRLKCLADSIFHLSYLAQSIAVSRPPLFVQYVEWARGMLSTRGIREEDLRSNLELLAKALQEQLEPAATRLARAYIEEALSGFSNAFQEPPTFLLRDSAYNRLATEYLNSLLLRKRDQALRLVLDAAKQGVPLRSIYLEVFEICQKEIGRLWQLNRLTVADEHYCTAATQLVMSQLYPYVFSGTKNERVLVAACPEGELHEVGLRILTDVFEMSGWNTYFLGANTPDQSLIRFLADLRPDVLAISATIGPHVQHVKTFVSAVKEEPTLIDTKVLVGGYPFLLIPDLWKQVGADGFAPNAEEAVGLAERIIG